MPFSRDYYFRRFKPPELLCLQAAYIRTCEVLERDPATHHLKDEMVREIIQIYECGVTSPENIAKLMRQIESVKPRPLTDPFQEAPKSPQSKKFA
ncbi:hypothetical protein H7Q97_07775 [Ochrobactrum sp. CM-21-5]|nr:hypothetical protein [Ochrobactrum sp. CM-21-5]MBC2885303.1 hypothetical protein [Ochrobactrum sp. CM-21-5]